MRRKFCTSLIIIIALAAFIHAAAAYDVHAADSGKQEFSRIVPEIRLSVYKDKTRIGWKEVKGAKYYIVYRSAHLIGKYEKIRKTTALSYKDGSGESGKIYYYKVRAYKSKKKHTRYSGAGRIRTVYRVYIACGHGISTNGAWDSGCTYKGMQEARLMLPITRDFVKYMRWSGVYVYTDADTDNDLNRDRCIRAANRKKISAYISIHCDWHLAPSGTMPLYRSRADRKLAEALNTAVHENISIRDRGLTRRPDLQELWRTKAVSCTFETGSIGKDYRIFRKKHDEYGRGLAIGLCRYLGIDFAGQEPLIADFRSAAS